MAAPANKIRLVAKSDLPIVEDALRPYRIWNSKTKENVPHRAYSIAIHAHWAAVHLVLGLGTNVPDDIQVGTVLEVYNTIDGRLIGHYVVRPGGKLDPWFDKKSLDERYEVKA